MKNEMIDLVQKMIACRPVSDNKPAVDKTTELLKDFLEKNGLICTIEKIDGRKVLYASTRPGKVTDILFNAHLDIVPATNEKQYIPEFRDGKLFARGSHDCLGNAVVIAETLCMDNGKHSIGAFFTTDEEIGGTTTKGMVELGYKGTKGVVILDTGTYSIAYAQKGIIEAKLTAKGRGGHASCPWDFDNPIEKLFKAYLKLASEWKNPTAQEQWGDSLAPCIISGGFAANQIPDTAEIVLNIRYIDASHRAQIVEKLKSTGLDVEIFEECPPVVAPVDNDLVKTLLAAEEKVTGKKYGTYRMNGATDARHLQVLNVPVTILGTPGSGAHAAEEWLDTEAMTVTVQILTEFINRFC